MLNVVIEDDRVLRILGLVLDPTAPADYVAAVADFMRHDVPNFADWLAELRSSLYGTVPAKLTYVADQAALDARISEADVAIVESLAVEQPQIARAQRLVMVQKFGTISTNIDVTACADRGIRVETHRRRQNVAVAEHALTLLLALSKRLPEVAGVVTTDRLAGAGFDPTPFDRRHTSNSNYGRVPGLRTLHGATLGIVGFGEIGRELARCARGFEMQVLYHQRTRLPASEEAQLRAEHVALAELMERCDYVSVHLPLTTATTGLLGQDVMRRAKPGQILVNTARAALIDRAALMDALDSGRLGGFGLDTGYEKPAAPDDPLHGRANVILTPHTAPASRLNGLRDIEDILRRIAAVVAESGRLHQDASEARSARQTW